jgi:hypothetical protein
MIRAPKNRGRAGSIAARSGKEDQPMTHAHATSEDTVTLTVSRQEYQWIVQGLHMMLNVRRFSFKKHDEDPTAVNRCLIDAIRRIESLASS